MLSGEVDMTDSGALQALNLYLSGRIDFDSLEDRVIPLAWEPPRGDHDLIYAILIEIAYIKDGASDETIFRDRLAKLAAPKPPARQSIL